MVSNRSRQDFLSSVFSIFNRVTALDPPLIISLLNGQPVDFFMLFSVTFHGHFFFFFLILWRWTTNLNIRIHWYLTGRLEKQENSTLIQGYILHL